jgi:hypothetical protein
MTKSRAQKGGVSRAFATLVVLGRKHRVRVCTCVRVCVCVCVCVCIELLTPALGYAGDAATDTGGC